MERAILIGAALGAISGLLIVLLLCVFFFVTWLKTQRRTRINGKISDIRKTVVRQKLKDDLIQERDKSFLIELVAAKRIKTDNPEKFPAYLDELISFYTERCRPVKQNE